jgi:DNA-binding beta-propeller fold protein YncE
MGNPDPIPAVTHSKFLYVVNSIEKSVIGYSINGATGALTAVGPAVPADDAPIYAAATPDGKFLYVANAGTNSKGVSGYRIDPATGVLTPMTPAAFPTTGSSEPLSIVVDPASTRVYTTNAVSISAFAINPQTGALTDVPGTPVAAPSNALLYGLAITPDGRFLYATEINNHQVLSFSIDAAGLPHLMGDPLRTGDFPAQVAVDPSGKFVYVANWISNDISRFSITPGTGVLVPAAQTTPVDLHCGPQEIAVDPTSRFVFVSCSGIGKIDQFGLNTTTGFLTPMTSFATGQFTQPRGIAVDRSGLFIYSAWNQQNRAGTTAIAANGDLTPVDGTPATGRGPLGVALSGQQ